MPPARSTPRARPPRERARYGLYVAAGLAVILLPLVVLSFMGSGGGDPLNLDERLCPADETAIVGRTVLLLDIGKPSDDANAGLASELLHRVTLDMVANSELQVFVVAASPFAPRLLLQRLCKPYANDSLAVATAKDGSGEPRDCDDLPAQVSRRIRDHATRFCEQRDALRKRIDGIIAQPRPATVASAYLVEAIEDSRLELAQFANPKLYVFSDMLQHAAWYSHAERGPDDWGFDGFIDARARQTSILSDSMQANPDLGVTVYYVPRRGLTEHPRVARAHQRFWHRYFVDVGSLTFEQQPVNVAYGVQPFAGRAHPAGLGPAAGAGREDESAATEPEPMQRQAVPRAVSGADDDVADVPTFADENADAKATAGAEREDESAAPEPEPPMRRQAAPRAISGADDELADVPTLADEDADEQATTVAAEPETQDDRPTDAVAAASRQAAVATEPEQPVREPAPGARSVAGYSGQVTLDNAPPEMAAAPAISASTQDPSPVIVAGGGTGDPEQPPPNDPATDNAATAAPSASPEQLATEANPETTTDPGPGPCTATLKPEFVGVDAYPLGGSTARRRSNYGSAEILIAYTIDEFGETVDDDVAVQPARSTVQVPRYMDLFTRRAEQVVRGWSFEFDGQDDCEKRQSQIVRLQFRYR